MERGSCAAGVIVFSVDHTQVVLVESKRAGNWCCPKGSRERGEGTTDCALRELREEAGIAAKDIDLLDNVYVDEITPKGTVGVRYRVAVIKQNTADMTLKSVNSDEILQLGWYTVAKACTFLKPSRQDALNKALESIQNNTAVGN